MARVAFLESSIPLTKTFVINEGGNLEKSSYPLVSKFTSYEEDILALHELFDAIERHSSFNRCLLKGELQRPLIKESRAGSTSASIPTNFLVLDIDANELNTIESVEQLLRLLPPEFDSISHIVQYSCSMGVDPHRTLSCHVYFWLDKAYRPSLLKEWLRHINFQVKELEGQMDLTASGMALKWPLDISVAQNDKLIYIAPPFLGDGVEDNFDLGDRVSLISKDKDTLKPKLGVVNAATNKELEAKKIQILRKARGLRVRQLKTKKMGSEDVVTNPDPIT